VKGRRKMGEGEEERMRWFAEGGEKETEERDPGSTFSRGMSVLLLLVSYDGAIALQEPQ
jgi:hypothetical protein